METLFVATFALLGFRLGARPISDNSMFTHLRTGIDIAQGQGIPRVDVYSWPALGTDWVVQSWFAEWIYGLAYRVGKLELVVFEQAVLMAVLASLIASLARTGAPLRTALVGSLAVGLGAAYWSPRPLIFGLLCMALLITAVERRWQPWVLVPVLWVWCNSHGSFPLALAWLGARVVGEWLDERRWPADTARYLWWAIVGLAVAAINPLGPKLLSFAVTLGDKQDVFRSIVEWRSPNFQTTTGLFTLACLGGALVILSRQRTRWADLLPTIGFVALGLIAVRNVPVAAVVIAPALGRALAVATPAKQAAASNRLHLGFLGVIAVAMVIFAVGIARERPLAVASYPVRASTYLDQNRLLDAPHRIAHQDVVGNYLVLRFGRGARVFIDDRYDMYPIELSKEYEKLLRATPGAAEILDRRKVDVVLWDRRQPLVALLRASGKWVTVYRDGDWVVLRRTAPPTGGT
jgi:hypothetical protein